MKQLAGIFTLKIVQTDRRPQMLFDENLSEKGRKCIFWLSAKYILCTLGCFISVKVLI